MDDEIRDEKKEYQKTAQMAPTVRSVNIGAKESSPCPEEYIDTSETKDETKEEQQLETSQPITMAQVSTPSQVTSITIVNKMTDSRSECSSTRADATVIVFTSISTATVTLVIVGFLWKWMCKRTISQHNTSLYIVGFKTTKNKLSKNIRRVPMDRL